jgi:hypothetical protein
MRASPLLPATFAAFVLLAAPTGGRVLSPGTRPAEEDYASLLRSAAASCRKAAGIFRGKVKECSEYLAGRADRRCSVTYNSSGGERREVAVEQAAAIADQFEATASEFDKRAAVRERLQGLQAAIGRLGLERRAEDFEEWEGLSRAAQEEFEKNTLDALITTALEGAKVSLAAAGSLNPFTAQKMIGKLKAAGVNDPRLFEAIRKLSRVQDKSQRAAAVGEALERLNRLRESAEAARAITAAAKGPSAEARTDATLEAIATVLGWANKQPALALLVADIKFATYSVYNNVTRRVSLEQVKQLTELTEAQLADLKILTGRVKETVQLLKKVEEQPLPEPCELK